MASLAFVESQLSRLPEGQRPLLRNAFEEVCKRLRFGRPTPGEPSENFAAGFYEGETPATPGQEFSIAHGFGRPPYLAMPVLNLQAVNSRTVPLTVTRAADARRAYFSSTIASAPIVVYLEA